MAHMRHFARRYGKITLATLGGFLVTVGTAMIVLSAVLVERTAQASTVTCQYLSQGSATPAGYACTSEPYQGTTRLKCCRWCGAIGGEPANPAGFTCTGCQDMDGNGIFEYCANCCIEAPEPFCVFSHNNNLYTCDSGCSATAAVQTAGVWSCPGTNLCAVAYGNRACVCPCTVIFIGVGGGPPAHVCRCYQ